MSSSGPSDRATQVLAAIFESAVDGIVVIDAGGLIEAFNPAAERLFGYTQSELIGQNVKLIMPPPYRDEHNGYLARYGRTGEARIIGIGREVQGLRRDGTIFPLHLSVGEMIVDGERKYTGNAAHAMQGHGRIRVSVSADHARCRVAFADSGPGIPAEVREKIFTPFFTTKKRGTGLGLPTAKRLIEAHGGTIDITCPPAGGTTVTVELPLAHAPATGPILESA